VPGGVAKELAMVAALKADHYARLERGRDHRPSEKVLEVLAHALRLDDNTSPSLAT
jgi:transcriptional regulator with XRE-family HTH domain